MPEPTWRTTLSFHIWRCATWTSVVSDTLASLLGRGLERAGLPTCASSTSARIIMDSPEYTYGALIFQILPDIATATSTSDIRERSTTPGFQDIATTREMGSL